MANPSTCEHPSWECSWRVDPVPGQIPPAFVQPALPVSRHYNVMLSIRCAACEEKLLHEGQPVYMPNSGQLIGATAGGTVLLLRATMPPQMALSEPQWQPQAQPKPAGQEPEEPQA